MTNAMTVTAEIVADEGCRPYTAYRAGRSLVSDKGDQLGLLVAGQEVLSGARNKAEAAEALRALLTDPRIERLIGVEDPPLIDAMAPLIDEVCDRRDAQRQGALAAGGVFFSVVSVGSTAAQRLGADLRKYWPVKPAVIAAR